MWTIWIERNDKVFNHEQWHVSKVKHQIWDSLIFYAKVAWKRVVEQIKISSFSALAMLQALIGLGELGMSFVEGTTCILNGTGKDNVARFGLS
jgi:hypothetical protein